MNGAPAGVVLATFGSAITADDVAPYLASVRGGREVPPDVLEEFRRRYHLIGRSPLIDITAAQAAALQAELDDTLVVPGMLHSAPRLTAALDHLADHCANPILVLILSPQYSPIILAGYERSIAAWRESHPDADVRIAGPWHLIDEWIEVLAAAVEASLGSLEPGLHDRVPIIFTAHSLPRAVVDRDPGYIDQLKETAAAVAARLSLPPERWRFAYQSAGHTPEEWLTPDVKDLLPDLRAARTSDILVVPLQFLADHLEILYDIDIAARDEARAAGITLHRIDLPNTNPTFIRALQAVVRRSLRSVAPSAFRERSPDARTSGRSQG